MLKHNENLDLESKISKFEFAEWNKGVSKMYEYK